VIDDDGTALQDLAMAVRRKRTQEYYFVPCEHEFSSRSETGPRVIGTKSRTKHSRQGNRPSSNSQRSRPPHIAGGIRHDICGWRREQAHQFTLVGQELLGEGFSRLWPTHHEPVPISAHLEANSLRLFEQLPVLVGRLDVRGHFGHFSGEELFCNFRVSRFGAVT
jgi:hypothetical protein